MRAATTAHRATNANTPAKDPARSRAAAAAGRRLWLAMALVLAVLCAVASAASAEPAHPNYVYAGTFSGQGDAPEQLSGPRRIAVEPGSGNILITDTGHNRVAVFSPELTPSASYLTEFGKGTLSQPFGIAIDRASGAIYVSDAGHHRIARFTSDGAPVPTYTIDPSFTSPTLGTGAGQVGGFAAALAVDPTTHDLLVADPVGRRVSRYTATGAFVSSFDGTGSPDGVFAELTDIAVAPTGVVYVTNLEGSPISYGTGDVERFQPDGASLGKLASLPLTVAVTVNPETGMVLAGSNPGFFETPYLFGFIGDEAAGRAEFPEYAPIEGLAVDNGRGRVYGLTSSVQVFTSVLAPGASVTAPSEVTTTSVRLQGTVDAGGEATTAHFEYSTDGGVEWTALEELTAQSGSGEVAVHTDLTGLAINTTYMVRLAAANSQTSTTTTPLSFTTTAAAPVAITAAASDRNATGVALNGQVNPYGLQTTYRFEYGPDTAYGQRLPVDGDGIVGKGHALRFVSVLLAGLAPGTTYHYRLVAQSSAGTTDGEDATFTTPSEGVAEQRAYEQVTPVEKTDAPLAPTVGFQVRPDGEGIVYQTHTPIDGPGQHSAPLEARYLALRGMEDWSLRSLDTPTLTHSFTGDLIVTVLAVSKDLSHSVVISNQSLAPGGVDGEANFYIQDLRTGSYQLIARGSATLYKYDSFAEGNLIAFYGGSNDFSTVVLRADEPLTSEGPPAAQDIDNLYEWSHGSLRLVTRLPDGSPSTGATPEMPATGDGHVVSEDGSRIVFSILGGTEPGVFVREGGHTVAISVSHRPGDPATPRPGTVQYVSRDGRYVFFVAGDKVPLTTEAPETPEGELAVYRYDRATDTLQFVSVTNQALARPLAYGDSGESAFLMNGNELVSWHNGSATPIASFDPTTLLVFQASKNGRYFAFVSWSRLTSYDNTNTTACATINGSNWGGSCPELYLYDAQTQSLACASCPSDGARALGSVNAAQTQDGLANYHARFVNDKGQLFFDTPTPLVPEDANGTSDVYEYREGEAHLITRGTIGSTSTFADSSESGRDVFFTTDDRLVGQDTDTYADLYDARVEGGIAAQAGAPAHSPACLLGQCPSAQGNGAAALPAIASVDFVGLQPAEVATRAAPRVSVTGKAARGSTFTVSVKVPGKGRIVGSGKGLARVHRTLAKGGAYKLRFSLTAAARRKLTRAGKLSVKVLVSYSPASGKASSAVVTVSLKSAGASSARAAGAARRAGR